MKVERQSIEIMAPVGSYDSLTAAIQAGADSVYFGIEGLNMRSKSSNNFTIDDLHNIAKICKEHNLRSYLTVNTIIYNNDMTLMHEIVNAAKEANLTAIIASDVAVMMYANSIGVEVHLSTQLNITNTQSLLFYSQFADVVVLARELNLDQVYAIYQDIETQQIKGPKGKLIQIEMFVHGALCMAVSGKCYLSLHEKNVSANRGACNQMCRRGYTVKEKDGNIELDIDNEYIMSPKDLKTIHFLNKLLDAGVRVLKIEGRARGPEYVRTVIECYREGVEAYCNDTFDSPKIENWNTRLATVFNRGFWDGYYLGQRLGEWSNNYGSGATKRKVQIGKALKYFSNMKVAEFSLETQSIKVGDELLITGPTTGAIFITPEEIHVDYEPVLEAVKGDTFSIKCEDKIRPADKIYKIITVNKKRKFVESIEEIESEDELLDAPH